MYIQQIFTKCSFIRLRFGYKNLMQLKQGRGFFFSPENMFVDLRERERERDRQTDRQRDGEKHCSVASHMLMCPNQGLNVQPRYVS